MSRGPGDRGGRRVLLVVGPVPPPPHGTSVYVQMLLESPAIAARWRVEHLDTSDRRSLENLGRVDLGNVRLGLAHAGQLAARLIRARPEVVWIPLSQNGPAYLRDALFIVLARAAGARVIGHLHGGWFHEFYRSAPAPLRVVIRRTCGLLAAAWVLGPNLKPCFAGLVPAARLRVVPNGVADPGAARTASRPEGPLTVLYLGQLSDLKGVDDLVAALGLVQAKGTRLQLAGEWLTRRDEQRIRALVAASPAAGRIELVGPVDRSAKGRCLGEADVLVLPARSHEGQPLVVLEAMAAGLPVIATRRGAIPDMVQDGVTGLLVPENSPPAIAEALDRLAGDGALRRRMGTAARERWERDYSADRAMARVLDELEAVMRDDFVEENRPPLAASVSSAR